MYYLNVFTGQSKFYETSSILMYISDQQNDKARISVSLQMPLAL